MLRKLPSTKYQFQKGFRQTRRPFSILKKVPGYNQKVHKSSKTTMSLEQVPELSYLKESMDVSANRFSMTYSQEDLIPRDGPASSDESFNGDDLADRVRELVLEDPKKLKGYKPMRVVMVQTAMGLKPPSGGFRGNYATLFALQKHGHETMQFCWAHEKDILHAVAELKAKGVWRDGCMAHDTTTMLNDEEEVVKVNWWKFRNVHGVLCVCLDADIMRYVYNNYNQQLDAAEWIETNERPTRAVLYAEWIERQIKMFNPTHVLFNDAFASVVTAKMNPKLMARVARVEVLHTCEQLPTGPFAGGVSGGSKTTAELPYFQALDGIVSVSKAVQKYALQECGLESEMIPNHAWSYKDKETGDWPRVRSNFAKQNVLMINPANIKGYEIFLGMAKMNQQRKAENNWDVLLERPVYNFIAYSSWGSQPEMVEELTAAGVHVMKSVTDMEPVFDSMSILIVPSLWNEAWGLVATEAQIRGIPVIASDIGGLPEAKRYVGPFVQVNKIDGNKRDATGKYIIPPQDIRPWMAELDQLLTDNDRYTAVSHSAYYTTRQWLRDFDVRGMEKFLLSIMKEHPRSRASSDSAESAQI